MDDFKKLIAEFSKLTNLDVQIDDEDSCLFEIDDVYVTLQYRPKLNDVVLFSLVSDPDRMSKLTSRVLYKALELAFNGEGTGDNFLGIYEGSLILTRKMLLNELTPEKLVKILDEFSKNSVYVKNTIFNAYIPFENEVREEISRGPDLFFANMLPV